MNFLNSTSGGSSLVLPSVSVPAPIYAAAFNSSNYAEVGDNSIPNSIGSGDFSIFAWIKTTNYGTDNGLVYIGNNTSEQGISLMLSPGGTVGCLVTQIGWAAEGSVNVTDGNWHFVGVVSSGGSAQIYVDGSTDGSSGSITIELSGVMYLGIAPDYGGLLGDMSEVTIFNRALSGDEITGLYNDGIGEYGDVSQAPWNSNLVAGYHLNGDFTDYSGNGHTASNNGDVNFVTGFVTPPINVAPGWSTILVNTINPPGVIVLETASENNGRIHIIKDASGNASVNNITIQPQSGQQIDGFDEKVIAFNNGSITLESDGTNWRVIAQEPSDTLAAGANGNVNIVGQIVGYNSSGATQFFPSAVAGSGANTVGSFGTDTNGLINLWTGTGAGGYGPIVAVSFANPLPYKPLVQVTAANTYASFLIPPAFVPYQAGFFGDGSTVSGFYLNTFSGYFGEGTGVADDVNYQWYYWVSGTPTPPRTGLTAWYSADSLSGSYNNGYYVNGWPDISGNGWSLTTSDPPMFATNVQNGLPGVNFLADEYCFFSNDLGLGPVCTIYVVCQPLTVGTNTIVGNNTDDVSMQLGIASNEWQLNDGVGFSGGTAEAGGKYIVVASYDEASSEIIVNGVVVATGEAGVNSSSSFILGCNSSLNNCFNGYIMEVLVYNDTTDPTAALNYLNTKWKIY